MYKFSDQKKIKSDSDIMISDTVRAAQKYSFTITIPGWVSARYSMLTLNGSSEKFSHICPLQTHLKLKPRHSSFNKFKSFVLNFVMVWATFSEVKHDKEVNML